MKLPLKLTLLTIAALACVGHATAAAAQEMPPGLWEIKAKMDMPGMPPEMAAKMGNQTFTQCITAGNNKWSDERSPSAQRSCERTDLKVSGNEISWKLKCKDGISGDGTVKHNNKDAYTMSMNMTSPRGVVKINSEGKLLSTSCQKK